MKLVDGIDESIGNDSDKNEDCEEEDEDCWHDQLHIPAGHHSVLQGILWVNFGFCFGSWLGVTWNLL